MEYVGFEPNKFSNRMHSPVDESQKWFRVPWSACRQHTPWFGLYRINATFNFHKYFIVNRFLLLDWQWCVIKGIARRVKEIRWIFAACDLEKLRHNNQETCFFAQQNMEMAFGLAFGATLHSQTFMHEIFIDSSSFYGFHSNELFYFRYVIQRNNFHWIFQQIRLPFFCHC